MGAYVAFFFFFGARRCRSNRTDIVRGVGVLWLSGTDQFDSAAVPRPDVRARNRDQGQLGHVLPDAG
jgi:hypothetical protein